MNMKSSPCAAWLAVLLISGLGIMGCSEADVPFSPEAESTETDPVVGIFTLVATALVEQRESPLAGVSMHGNYAYVGGMSTGYNTTANIGVRIVDVSDPTNPQLVGRIPLRDRGTRDDHSHGDAVATHIASGAFQGDVAIVLYGVPDEFTPGSYPQPYGLWDVTDPSNPTFLSVLNLGNSSHAIEAGSLGDKPYDATAVAGNYVYAIYNKSQTNGGNHIPLGRDLTITWPSWTSRTLGNPVVVGDWQDDPGAWLAGVSLNESATRAYVTGFTGSTERSPDGGWVGNGYLFVLDIQNPSQPTELGRYVLSCEQCRRFDRPPNERRCTRRSRRPQLGRREMWDTSYTRYLQPSRDQRDLEFRLAGVIVVTVAPSPPMWRSEGTWFIRLGSDQAYEPSTSRIPRIRFRWRSFNLFQFKVVPLFQTWRSSAPISW